MINLIRSHIISLKYIWLLIRHTQDNPPKVIIKDESYKGLKGEDVILRTFIPKERKIRPVKSEEEMLSLCTCTDNTLFP